MLRDQDDTEERFVKIDYCLTFQWKPVLEPDHIITDNSFPECALHTFWVRGRASRKGVDFPDIDLRSSIDFQFWYKECLRNVHRFNSPLQ